MIVKLCGKSLTENEWGDESWIVPYWLCCPFTHRFRHIFKTEYFLVVLENVVARLGIACLLQVWLGSQYVSTLLWCNWGRGTLDVCHAEDVAHADRATHRLWIRLIRYVIIGPLWIHVFLKPSKETSADSSEETAISIAREDETFGVTNGTIETVYLSNYLLRSGTLWREKELSLIMFYWLKE